LVSEFISTAFSKRSIVQSATAKHTLLEKWFMKAKEQKLLNGNMLIAHNHKIKA